MNEWASEYVVSHGTRLHYYRTSGAKPPLVLIHGITDDGLCWTPVAELLAETHDVVMVDLRGHGKSEAPDGGYDYETMATEVAGLITGLGLEKPVVMGHSLGAMTSLTVAGLFPNLPRALILEDPPAFWRTGPPSQDQLHARAEMRAHFHELKRKTCAELLEMARAERPDWPEAEFGPWVDAKQRFSIKIVQMLGSRETVPADFRDLLERITCPALLLTADPEQGAILTDQDVADLRKLVPHLHREQLPGAGHNIRREQFSRYMNVVEGFLDEI